MVASLPAKVHLTGQLISTPNIGHLSLDHDRTEVEELGQG